jgi:NAD(P)-dependent dehydrogenase (short-subunit alcohol dehydrogenase family)
MGMAKGALDQAAQVQLARFSESAEIAKAMTYLASADHAYVSGTELLVDGDMTPEKLFVQRKRQSSRP